jgi:hypothetical protein
MHRTLEIPFRHTVLRRLVCRIVAGLAMGKQRNQGGDRMALHRMPNFPYKWMYITMTEFDHLQRFGCNALLLRNYLVKWKPQVSSLSEHLSRDSLQGPWTGLVKEGTILFPSNILLLVVSRAECVCDTLGPNVSRRQCM